VPCKYPGLKVTFRVDQGASAYYFAVFIQYEAGDGDLGTVGLLQVFHTAKFQNLFHFICI
jgi:hypothetical protein